MNTLSVELGTVQSGVDGDHGKARDEDLVCAAIDGNPDAFAELVARHRQGAMKVAIAIVGLDRAEDVVQESLLQAFRALRAVRDRGRFPQWLATIPRFRALRVGRLEMRHTRGRVVLDDDFLETYAAPDEGRHPESLEMAEVLEALDSLPRHYADVIRLHFLKDLPHDAISKQLGIPLSTVKWRCFRGKELLRERLAAEHPDRRQIPDDCENCQTKGFRVTCNRESPERRCEGRAECAEDVVQPDSRPVRANGGLR